MQVNEILFRASSAGHLMTNPRNKSDLLSETTKTHLVDVYVTSRYGRHTDVTTKAIEKGLQVEEDSITLYSLVTGKFLVKNEQKFANQYIRGTPDIIHNGVIYDIKSSFDIFTFHRRINKPLDPMYYWQMQCYMELAGIEVSKVVYCLVDTPPVMVEDEKRRLAWKMGLIDPDASAVYRLAAEKIEKNMTYPDIDLHERVFEFTVTRDPIAIHRLYSRIDNCRVFLSQMLNQNMARKKVANH